MELQTDIILRAWNLKRDGKYILIIIALWLAVWLIFSLPPRRSLSGQGGKKKTADSALCLNLKVWYDSYNETYFLNQLPKNTIVEYGDIGNDLGITFKDHGKFHIIISRYFNRAPNTAHETLLHEIAHVATWGQEFDSHGPKFRACLRRLYAEGAFEGLL